ncbi:uncharacterized protein LOC115216710 [Argonauta hians]
MENENSLSGSETMFNDYSMFNDLSPSRENLDPFVKQSVNQCFQVNNTLPLIKLQLKTKVELNRHNNGQTLVFEDEPKQKHEMTFLEIQRRNEMKNRNKIAAKKYRDKMRAKDAEIKKFLENEQTKNKQLKTTLKSLEEELAVLNARKASLEEQEIKMELSP